MELGTTHLVPRSITRRKSAQASAGPSKTKAAPVTAFTPGKSTPERQADRRQEDSSPLISLVTCTITDCSISKDFEIRLRTPQGCKLVETPPGKAHPNPLVIEISTLLQQLCTRKRESPASIAMALSKAPELYKVRLARVRTFGHIRRPTYNTPLGDDPDELQGGGYEFQFLDGQQRARRTEELLAASAVVLVCLLHLANTLLT
jgi:hypothetical protein